MANEVNVLEIQGMTAEEIEEMASSLAQFDAGHLPEKDKGPNNVNVMIGKGGSFWMQGPNGSWIVQGISMQDWLLYKGSKGNKGKEGKGMDGNALVEMAGKGSGGKGGKGEDSKGGKGEDSKGGKGKGGESSGQQGSS